MRDTGIEIIRDAPWGTHFCQFYRERRDLTEILVPYFKAGLEANEACMWITSPDLTATQAKAALRRVVPKLDEYLKTGQLEILPHTKWYLKGGSFDLNRVLNGWIEKLNAAQARGFEGLRLTSNTVWLEKKDWRDFTDYEEAINTVIGKYNILALCTYSLNVCGAAEVLDVLRNHQFALIRNESQWEIIESSDSKAARLALQETQERLAWLASFPERNPNPVMEIDFEKDAIVYANDAAQRLMPDLLARGLEHPWFAGIHDIAAELKLSGKNLIRHEVRIGESWFEQNISQAGHSCCLRIYGTDITERKNAEDSLAASHEQTLHEKRNLEALMTALPVGVAIVDAKGGNLRSNPMYEAVWGEGRPETHDVEDYSAYKAWWVDTGKPVKPEEWASARAVTAGESVLGQLLRIQRFDGRPAYVINSAVPIHDAHGDITGSAVAIQDITQRMEAEEALRESEGRLRLALTATELGTWDYNPVTGALLWDARCKELFGLPPEAEVDYEIFIAGLHPDDRDRAHEIVQRSFDPAGDGLFDIEYRTVGLRDGGVERWIRATGRASFNDAGQAIRFIGTVQNITERKKAQDALRESEVGLKRSQEIAHLGSWELDLTRNRLTWSDEVYRIFGLQPQEFSATYEAFLERVHPDDRQKVDDAYAGSLRQNLDSYEVKHRVIRKDTGEIRFVHEKCEHFRDAAGKIVRSVGMVHDITESKRAEDALRQNREYLRVTLSSIGDAVIAADPSGAITFFNKVAAVLSGWPTHEAIGRPIGEIFRIHNEETGLPAEDIVGRVLREGGIVGLANHTALIRRDGTLVPIEDSAAPIRDNDGNIAGVVLVFHDVTEKRRVQEALRLSENELRLVMDTVPALIAYVGADLRYRRVNKTFANWLGKSAEEIVGRHVREVVGEQSWTRVKSQVDRVLAGETVTFEQRLEYRLEAPWAQVTLVPDLDRNGRTQGYVAHVMDISIRKGAEEELRSNQVQLQTIIENIDQGLVVSTLEGELYHWNPAALKIHGFKSLDECKRYLPDFAKIFELATLDGTVLPVDEWPLARILRGEKVHDLELVISRLNEPWQRIFNYGGEIVRLTEGEPLLAVVTVSDITERKAAEASLAESRRRIATILDSIADGFYALDREWRFIHINDAAIAYFGMNRESMIGRTIWDVFPRVAGSPFEDAFRKAMQNGEPVHFIHRSMVVPDKIVEMNAYPGADNLTVLFRDVTERIEREAELQRLNRTLTALSHSDRAMMRATDEPSYLAEVCQIVTEDCGHAMVWIGYAEDDERKTVRPVASAGFEEGYLETLKITWADSERGYGPTGTAIRTGEPAMCRNMLTDPKFEPWRKEALRRGYSSSLVVPLRADGRTLGALSIYSRLPEAFSDEEINLLSRLADDLAYGIVALRLRAAHAHAEAELVEINRTLAERIAERTFQLDRLNADLERRANQLRALAHELTETEERERRRLADILHDDLQQLLVGAKLHVGILPSRMSNPASFRELLGQITNMLDESIGKSRGMAHELSPPLLRQQGLVAALEWLGRQMKNKYGLDVRMTVDTEIEPSDALKVFLFRAAQEMLFNVVKHAAVSEAEIILEQCDDALRLTVADNGKGFEAPGGMPSSDWGAGGFGLFSIRERANLLGGRLRIVSSPGQGSRFILEIPIERIEPEATETQAAPASAVAASAAGAESLNGEKPLRVLLVDDHQVMRQGLAAILSNASGIVVVGEAEDGRQAVDMVQKCRPDVVIMDVSMPIMDGIEATRRIKREWPDLCIVGLSMFEEEDLAEAMMEAGADSYLSKVRGLRELVDVIRNTKPGLRKGAANPS